MRNVRLALIAVSLMGACTATAQSPRDRAPEPRIIEGIVRDALTHQPIDRASVHISFAGIPREVTVGTGPDGRYRTGEIPRGELGIRVRREGYLSFDRTGTMDDGIVHIDIELVPLRR